MHAATYAALLTSQTGRPHGITTGPRFARVYRQDPTSRSVVAFVEVATGMIWRASGWKCPAYSTGHTVADVVTRAAQ